MNVYLISFMSRTGKVNRIDIQNFLNTRREVLNWYGIMPNAILVSTDSTDHELVRWLSERFSNDITFLVTKTEPNRTTGFINQEVWDFINNPKTSNQKPLGLKGLNFNS